MNSFERMFVSTFFSHCSHIMYKNICSIGTNFCANDTLNNRTRTVEFQKISLKYPNF